MVLAVLSSLKMGNNFPQMATDLDHPSSAEAVTDVKVGKVRHVHKDGTDYLLIPVIGLQPLVGWDRAQWSFIGRRFQGPCLKSAGFWSSAACSLG